MSDNELDKSLSIASEHGSEYEGKYRSCGQCTIAAIQDALGIRNDIVFKCASSLGGGIGKLCDGSCGAYVGSILMIGLYWGRQRSKFDDDDQNRRTADKLAVLLHDRFIREYGSVTCREIHDRLFGRRFDLWNDSDKAAFDKAGAHTDKCTSVVAKAASWTTEIILGELGSRGQTATQSQHANWKEA
jgi:C_GCAxxG_C_C family probable redox protein